MNRIVGTVVTTLALLVVSAPAAQAAVVTPTQVNVTLTSAWTPPSSDPSGLTYRASTSKILVSDADVDETTLGTGVNIWEMSPAGAVATTGNTNARTTEPLDVAWDNVGNHLYVVDDAQDDVFRINPQADGLFGTTGDTTSRELNTNAAGFDSFDPEGLAYRADDRSIYLTDGATSTLFHVERGPDGVWGGGTVGDDIITSFDTAALGIRDPEDVEYDPASGNLLLVSRNDDVIAEVTTAGVLVNTIDIAFANLVHPTGITLAPGSDEASETHIYVSDRGATEGASPGQNDGRIFEFAIETVPGNQAPVVVSPGDQTSVEGEDVTLQIEASDSDNDTLTYEATGLPADLAIDPATGQITGTIAAGAAATSPYSVTVTASDGTLEDSETFSWAVTEPGSNAPPVVTSPGDQTSVEGEGVTLQIEASDSDNDTLTYEATGLPADLAIASDTGLITGTIAEGAAATSPYSVTVTASDGTLDDSETFSWAVTEPGSNSPPVVTSPGNQTDAEGDAVSLQIEAVDDDGDTLTYEATGLPADLVIDPETGVISGTIAAGAAATSPYTVVVSADDGTATGSETFEWTVTEASEPSILFRSASTGASAQGSKMRVVTIPAPAGVQAGDVLVAAIDTRGAKVKTPAGWTLVRAKDSSSNLRQAMYVRVAEAEPASYQFTLSTSAVAVGAIAAYEGVDTESPVDAAAARKKTRSTSITAPSVTAVAPNSVLVGAFGIATDASIAPPATMTERAEASTVGRSKAVAVELSDETVAEVGPTGERDATASKSAANIGAVVLLHPAS